MIRRVIGCACYDDEHDVMYPKVYLEMSNCMDTKNIFKLCIFIIYIHRLKKKNYNL